MMLSLNRMQWCPRRRTLRRTRRTRARLMGIRLRAPAGHTTRRGGVGPGLTGVGS